MCGLGVVWVSECMCRDVVECVTEGVIRGVEGCVVQRCVRQKVSKEGKNKLRCGLLMRALHL